MNVPMELPILESINTNRVLVMRFLYQPFKLHASPERFSMSFT